jgi:hypothetical protein
MKTKSLKATTIKVVKIQSIQSYIKHQIWLGIQRKCELNENFNLGLYKGTPSKYFSEINTLNGKISAYKEIGTTLGRVYSGIEEEYEIPTKVYAKAKPLEINELGEEDTQPIDNQSVTNY